ncbi:PAS domain S-box protein, partial [Pseudomonadota bacterium]
MNVSNPSILAPKPALTRSLWISARWAITPMVLGALLVQVLLPEWRWNHELFHALIEGSGSVIGIGLLFIIVGMIKKQRLAGNYCWLAACFLSMGTLDLAHAVMPPGQSFVWLHSSATFIGGLFASLIWLSPKMSERLFRKKSIVGLAVLSVSFSLWSVFWPDASIAMLDENNNFTPAAKFLNMAGGIGFLIAWAYFAKCYHYQHHPESFYFSNHFCLFAIAGLLFEASILWDANWWLWHMLRAFAYILLMVHFGRKYWQDLTNLDVTNHALHREISEHRATVAQLNLTSSVFRHTSEAIIITDTTPEIIDCNPAFSDITGYSAQEVVGKNPNILASGLHDSDFFEEMWRAVYE